MCPTILNNERAALKKATELYMNAKKVTKAKRWIDPDFGPKNDRDNVGSGMSLYTNGDPPGPGFKQVKDIEWMLFDEIVQKVKPTNEDDEVVTEATFISGGASSNEVK